ncbi:MAG: DUF4252 domain-containing protein [Candidatus Kapaibacterium sp.]|jgi:hypothetical protein|nr:DUF4252 domain-containing protein [Candidatus Kapabacteria bacterium]
MIRTFYILFLFLSATGFAFAQNKAVDSFISKYSDKDGFKAVVMNDPASLILKNQSGEKAEVTKDLLKGIKTIKALTYKCENNKLSDDGKAFSSELTKFNPGDGFTELMSMKEGKNFVKSLVHKQGEKINEFVMVVAGESESTLIWINGDIDLQKIANIGKILKF